MTLDQFYAKYNNQPVEVDGSYPNQCWDLAALYNELVIGIPASQDYGLPTGPIGGAKEVYTYFKDPLSNYFVRLSISASPQKGDLVVWDVGQYGHIAIFLKGTLQNFQSFDQNWPLGSYAHLQEHNSTGVIGFLRPKTNLSYEEEPMNHGDVDNYFKVFVGHEPTEADYAAWIGQPHKKFLYEKATPEVNGRKVNNGDLVNFFPTFTNHAPSDADHKAWEGKEFKSFAYDKLLPEAKQRIK